MARMNLNPGHLYMVEELTLARAREHATLIMAAFEELPKWMKLHTGEHGPHMEERLKAYAICAEEIGKAFDTLDIAIASARTTEEGRDRERAAAAKVRVDDLAVDKGLMTQATRLAMASRTRGDGEVSMTCPVCETNESIDLDQGVCIRCNAYAIDARAPNPRGAIRYRPAKVEPIQPNDPIANPTPPPPDARPDVVSVLKASGPDIETDASGMVTKLTLRQPHPFKPMPGIETCGKPLDCGGTCCLPPGHTFPLAQCMCIGDDEGEPGSCPA